MEQRNESCASSSRHLLFLALTDDRAETGAREQNRARPLGIPGGLNFGLMMQSGASAGFGAETYITATSCKMKFWEFGVERLGRSGRIDSSSGARSGGLTAPCGFSGKSKAMPVLLDGEQSRPR